MLTTNLITLESGQTIVEVIWDCFTVVDAD